VRVLRKAFQETLKDPAFVAEMDKAKLTLEPATAEELERLVAEVFALDQTLVAKLKDRPLQVAGGGRPERGAAAPSGNLRVVRERTETRQ